MAVTLVCIQFALSVEVWLIVALDADVVLRGVEQVLFVRAEVSLASCTIIYMLPQLSQVLLKSLD